VNVDAATIIRMKQNAITLADIKVGDRVEAEGTKIDDHTLLAKHIQLEDENENDDEAEIKGTVKSVGASSLVVTTSKGDITVMVDSSTEIRRHGDHLALSDIKVGNQVEAEGTMVDPQTLKAKKISVEGGH